MILSVRLWGIKILVTMIVATFMTCLVAQDTPVPGCGGLHAAIRGELVRPDPTTTQQPFVMLDFILLNDSQKPINAVEQGWKIVIDDKELEWSNLIFGNGPGPVGGWGVLAPGESYEFGKGLELSRYFPEEREYRVFWKGKGFRSSTITIRVTPAQIPSKPMTGKACDEHGKAYVTEKNKDESEIALGRNFNWTFLAVHYDSHTNICYVMYDRFVRGLGRILEQIRIDDIEANHIAGFSSLWTSDHDGRPIYSKPS